MASCPSESSPERRAASASRSPARSPSAAGALVVDARDARRARRRGRRARTASSPIPGDVTDARHRSALVAAAGDADRPARQQREPLGPSPQPALAAYPLDELRRVYETNVLAPLALVQAALPRSPRARRSSTSPRTRRSRPYAGWGGYGSSKAALEQVTAILAAEHPELRIYAVDPGDMRTQMHQDAFPGEDISDRPPPEESVPGLLALIEG